MLPKRGFEIEILIRFPSNGIHFSPIKSIFAFGLEEGEKSIECKEDRGNRSLVVSAFRSLKVRKLSLMACPILN
ncbi:hypothetical protein H5410_053677 [Solanum commersonii]|uniref:Uncharacterized protein n=1 Tax=Solanum commersonii TaxID=4109 RepID=A0A9J5X570_SOLCO|nr:hypothetical protein H5410_053677 [Solanum commersonii]